MIFFPLNKRKVILSIAIAVTALVGDHNSEDPENPLAGAICDNVTHALIGALTWIAMFVSQNFKPSLSFFIEVALCGLLSSVMDVDHFVAARSLQLKNATSLKHRPPMHCTTLVLFLVLSVVGISMYFKLSELYKFGWILAAAFLSHQIRDGKRRGLWMRPFGSTPPIPKALYIAFEMLLPHMLTIIMVNYAPSSTAIHSSYNLQSV